MQLEQMMSICGDTGAKLYQLNYQANLKLIKLYFLFIWSVLLLFWSWYSSLLSFTMDRMSRNTLHLQRVIVNPSLMQIADCYSIVKINECFYNARWAKNQPLLHWPVFAIIWPHLEEAFLFHQTPSTLYWFSKRLVVWIQVICWSWSQCVLPSLFTLLCW